MALTKLNSIVPLAGGDQTQPGPPGESLSALATPVAHGTFRGFSQPKAYRRIIWRSHTSHGLSLGRVGYAFAWASVYAFHGLCASYFVAAGLLYAFIPGSWLAWDMDNYVRSLSPRYFQGIAFVHHVFAALHIASGIFGVESEYFELIFALRELVEVVLQSLQAYQMSIRIPRRGLNRVFVALLVLNCWSSPLVHRFVRDKAQQRMLCLLADLLLDFVVSIGIPVVLSTTYIRLFDVEQMYFPLEFYYTDKRFVNYINETPIILFGGWTDVLSRLIFSLGVLVGMNDIKTLILLRSSHHKPPEGLLSPSFPPSLNDVELSFTNLRSLPENLDTLWHTRMVLFLEFAEFDHVPSVLARLEPDQLSLNGNGFQFVPPELFVSPSIDYLGLAFLKIDASPDNVDRAAVTGLRKLQNAHTSVSALPSWMDATFFTDHQVYAAGTPLESAPATELRVHVAPVVYVFAQLGVLVLHGVCATYLIAAGLLYANLPKTRVVWNLQHYTSVLAIESFPLIAIVQYVIGVLDFVATIGIPVVLALTYFERYNHKYLAFPFEQFYDDRWFVNFVNEMPIILFSSWLDAFNRFAFSNLVLFLEFCEFDSFPDVLTRMGILQLVLAGNAITSINATQIALPGLEYLALSQTLLTELPEEGVDSSLMTELRMLRLDGTSIWDLPVWMDAVFLARCRVYAALTPYCFKQNIPFLGNPHNVETKAKDEVDCNITMDVYYPHDVEQRLDETW
ncbi:hypothetical protein P43SY_009105 [Pythium insidiosum]|uniref:Transmembrane protein n=1 Tax=Pythium insidiosum TaxID=114742 RepID=A0AAD5M4Z8_PYTIN|nr:hypothetical protein P43SY_009105 [Pythium insidiosum]